MVYLITANTLSTLGDPDTSGLNNPSAYVNTMSQTFEIEKDSEIAVESLKITRNGNIQISSANNKFGIYLGDNLRAETQEGLQQDLGWVNSTYIRGGNATLSPLDLCQNIKQGMIAGLGQHPNFTSIDTNFPKVELKNGSGAFTGFKYSFSQNLSGATPTPIPAVAGQGGWVSTDLVNLNAVVSASGSAGAVKLEKKDPQELVGDMSVIGQKYPINQSNGSVVFIFNSSANGSAGKDWEVGLTRATFNACQTDIFPGVPENFRDNVSVFDFFDYSVKNVSNVLNVFVCGYKGDVHRKIQINDTPYGTKNIADFKGVKFIVKGDSVEISLIKNNGTEEAWIENDKGTKLSKLKPVGVSNYYLFPKVNISSSSSASRVMVVESYSGLDIPTFDFNSSRNLSFQYGGLFDTGVANTPAILGNVMSNRPTRQCWYCHTSIRGGTGLIDMAENRPPFDYDDTYEIVLGGLNASGGLDKNIVIISAEDNVYNGAPLGTGSNFWDGGWTRTFGAQNTLGFENTPPQFVDTYVGAGNGNLGVIESKSVPKMVSNKSLFVRLPDLPINSFNSGKGSVSKILYHCPRFDNSGNEIGGLYYQPNERLYVPLNNPEKIRLNNLKVELCNANETTNSVDLVGQTIVCFDIRRRQRL
jgi:hypothetical protein